MAYHPAYLAGFVDGEGSLGIRLRRKNGNVYYQAKVSISQKRPDVLLPIQEQYGGFLRMNKTTQVWNLIIECGRVRVLIADILPYLVVKRPAALAMMEFFEMKGERNPAKRARLREEIMEANRLASVAVDI